MVLMSKKRMDRRGIKREVWEGDASDRYDPTIQDPSFYAEAAKGGGIEGLTYKPPFPTHTAWPYRVDMVCKFLRPYDRILEIGAGFGILPAIAWHSGLKGEYYGYDFCEQALKEAEEGNKEFAHQHAEFEALNFDSDEGRAAIHSRLKGAADDCNPYVVVSCETLEHLENDVELVKAIPSGTFCIFTVPQFWAKSHLRKFSKPGDARDRYGHLLNARYEKFQFYRVAGSGWIMIWGLRK